MDKDKRNKIPLRYIVSLLACLASFLNMICRSSFTISILAMVNSTDLQKTVTGSLECQSSSSNHSQVHTQTFTNAGRYSWDPYTQGILLAAENYGVLVTQLFSGRLAELYGAKWVTGGGVLVMGTFLALTPTAADLGLPFIITTRVIQGLGEGLIMPAVYTLTSEWLVHSEKVTVIVFAIVSGVIGSGVGAISAGVFSSSDFLGGWPASFYVPAFVTFVWTIFWAYLVSSHPEDHPKISSKELDFISAKNGQNGTKVTEKKKKRDMPWRAIFKSGPFWALIVVRFSHFWFSVTLNTAVPLYLNAVFGMTVAENGVINGVLYIVAISGIFFERFAQLVKQKTKWSSTVIRKIACLIAYGSAALCWILIPFSRCNMTQMITLLYVSKILYTFSYAGDTVVMVDMAPQFSGTLFGISSTAGSCAAFISPMLTGYITKENVSITQWGYVFYMAAAIYLVGLIWFLVWGSAELQPWARKEETEQKSLVLTNSVSDYGSMAESV